MAIDNMRDGKACGLDGVVNEVMKYGGRMMRLSLYRLCCCMWENEKVPKNWMKGLIFPILKKGSDSDMNNYRGITLLSVVSKVYAVVLNNRLMAWGEGGVLVDEQYIRFSSGSRMP